MNSQVTPELSRRAKEQEATLSYDIKEKSWNQVVKATITREVFPLKQFLWRAIDSEFGSAWQTKICTDANIPKPKWELYWNRSARTLSKKTLSKRRTNTTNQMKAEFMSRSCWPVHIRPPVVTCASGSNTPAVLCHLKRPLTCLRTPVLCYSPLNIAGCNRLSQKKWRGVGECQTHK
jgi:hypothetical protein